MFAEFVPGETAATTRAAADRCNAAACVARAKAKGGGNPLYIDMGHFAERAHAAAGRAADVVTLVEQLDEGKSVTLLLAKATLAAYAAATVADEITDAILAAD